MPADIPEIQLDNNWLEDIDSDENDLEGVEGKKSAHDELTIANAGRRKSRKNSDLQLNKSNTADESKSQNDHDDQGRLEDQMNYDHLRRLEEIFEEADQDGKLHILNTVPKIYGPQVQKKMSSI